MPFKRFLAVIVALIALITPVLAQYPSSAQAARQKSPAAVVAWNGIARREAIQVAKQSTAHAMVSIAYAQVSAMLRVIAGSGCGVGE